MLPPFFIHISQYEPYQVRQIWLYSIALTGELVMALSMTRPCNSKTIFISIPLFFSTLQELSLNVGLTTYLFIVFAYGVIIKNRNTIVNIFFQQISETSFKIESYTLIDTLSFFHLLRLQNNET